MRRISLALALAAAVIFGMADTALADEPSANTNAACAGIGSSWAGPQGIRDNVAHNTQAFAERLGVTPGYLVTMAALDHSGSFFACFGFNP